ncbi:hypothetical protein [Actinoplanes subtropicus]|uniref:hypothetical protein n=1 Tax=Actinoplanes subtropicus TaxID=543632 RepID=UPI0004C3CC39|nr:hypothetical protein [Actinoplanes subtropicus]
MSVTRVLFRLYRPIILPFVVMIVLADVIATVAVTSVRHPDFSMWLVLGGAAAKYWILVIGIILVAMHLRQFVVNGATRHEFLAGVAVFGLILAVAWAIAVPLGHGIESAVLGAAGKRGPGYPVLTAGGALRQFGQQLPISLAYLVSGAMIATGFYRWRAWTGLVVMLGGAVPALATDWLLGFDVWGGLNRGVPYPAGLALSVAAIALVAWGLHRAISDVPIRPTAG